MNISEIKSNLKANGIDINSHTLRRRIDAYIHCPTRNHKTNQRDLTQEEFERLCIALAIEAKGKTEREVVSYIEGDTAKTELIELVIDSNKVDMILRRWLEE